MEANTIWSEEMEIKSSETDFQKRLKLSSFFELMQDLASSHASRLGVGYEDLQKRELAWVLSRKKVRFFDFPEMGETVRLATWPKGIQQKLFFMRDHEMTAAGGRLLATSTSAYVLVSTRVRRIVLPNALEMPIPDNNGRSAIDELLEKIVPLETLSPCLTLTVGYSALDIMGHTNNARYIEWISDCFSIEEHQTQRPAWLQINYLNEVRPGEAVQILRGQREEAPGVWYLAGVNQATGAKAFEAEICWEPAENSRPL
jgi:medium-chain acyl-[acyl-carrier-protein] hydrolase